MMNTRLGSIISDEYNLIISKMYKITPSISYK